MEIHFFIKKMESFQKNINKIDINLSNSLIDILHNIQSFIDNSEIIQTNNTSFALNDNECIQIQRNYYCLACNMNIAAKKDKILEHIALEKHKQSVIREDRRKLRSAVYNMNDPLPMPPSNSNGPITSINQDTNVPKLSQENLEIMKMQQNHQQQLQQKHQMFLQDKLASQMAPVHLLNVQQQTNGFVVQSFVPFTQQPQPIIRPNFYAGQPIRFSPPFSRDVPGMKEVRSSPAPLMSLNVTNPVANQDDRESDIGARSSRSSSFSSSANLPNTSRSSRSPRRSDRSESSNSSRYVQARPIKTVLSRQTMKQTRIMFMQDIVCETNKFVEFGRRAISSVQYQNIIDDLETKLKPIWPKVKAYCFGSRVNGLASFGGDLDIFIDVGNKYNEGKLTDNDFLVECVEKTELALNIKNSDWKGFEAVKIARIPILRALNNKEGIDCDLSFTNGLSHCNTELMKYFMDLQPVCIKLCVFIKYWSKNFHFKTPSYGFVLKVIFYLQEKKVLPSVRELQVGAEKYSIGPWKANFCDKSLRELNIARNDDFIPHLIGFFDYYAQFDYENNVICPYLGHTISKTVLNSNFFIPELKLYNDYIETLDLKVQDSRHILFDIEAPICTQDPLELCHNVTRNFKMSSIDKFVDLCKLSFVLLKERKF